MSELAVRAVNNTPGLDQLQDRRDFFRAQPMHWGAAWRLVSQRADVSAPSTPAVHPVIRYLPEPAHPGMHEPGRDCAVNALEHGFFGFSAHSGWERPGQAQTDFPRTTANSIA